MNRFPHSPHLLPYAGHCLSTCPVTQYLQFSTFFYVLRASLSCPSTLCLKLSNCLASFMLSSVIFVFSVSTLFLPLSALSHLASSMSSYVAFSLNISLIMPSSFSPLMDCSVSNLSYYLYSHSIAFVHSLSIHSRADSLPSLHNLWYWTDMTILLCHSLNLVIKTEKRPFKAVDFPELPMFN